MRDDLKRTGRCERGVEFGLGSDNEKESIQSGYAAAHRGKRRAFRQVSGIGYRPEAKPQNIFW